MMEISGLDTSLEPTSAAFAAMLDAVGHGVVAVDRQWRLSFVNAWMERVLGRSRQELLGHELWAEFPTLRTSSFGAAYLRAMRDGVEVVHEGFVPISNAWFESRASPCATGLILFIKDVTERRRAAQELKDREERLRESETLFRKLADSAPVMLWMTDARVSCVWHNRRWYDFTGQTEAEALGLGWLDAIHPEDRAKVGGVLQASIARWVPYPVEYRLRTRDGQYRWTLAYASPRVGESGEFLGYIGSVIDIHERKRGEERLAFVSEASRILSESLDYEDTLARATQLAVPVLGDWCMVDLLQEGGGIKRVKVSWADPALEPLARETVRFPPQVSGHPSHLPSRVLLEARALLVEDADDAYKQRAAYSPEHLAHMRAIGFQSVMSVPMVARGRTLGVITFLAIAPGRRFTQADLETAEDLARRAALAVDNGRLYHEAQQAVRVREEFLQVASHELKTPLTPLSLKLQLLARTAESLPRERFPRLSSDLDMMRQQVQRLSSLMDELLDVSRINAGRFSMTLEVVDLSALVRDAAARFEPEVLRLGGRLMVDVPEPLVGVWDRQRLEQVMTNLLSNAQKYGGGRPVRARVWREGHLACIAVRDEGIGIAPEALSRIFEKFERAVSERHYGGLGLGLYITRQIVEALGGTICVESAPNQGSTFTVKLPLTPPPVSPERKEGPWAPAHPLPGSEGACYGRLR
ncbi:PAS domain S-box protein [Pyxidicoccus fallax]|uniref:histidine kinase n=1 Tax=Pyxidicoccus fallax TaxID=394095 RepID=A0A848L9K6_9BACT|nr:PAS domain S-box protein [Pyxidicoccus fallax]NMO13535.1 PAS domain S-box protein [Pyxidicoccus fallax]NPC76757.1 PAS domain S-box protein [Pyxidicoccus fallax]